MGEVGYQGDPVAHFPLSQTAAGPEGHGQMYGFEISFARSASYCACAFTLTTAFAQFVHLFAPQKSPSGSVTQSASVAHDWS
jgi:hypothetical protein